MATVERDTDYERMARAIDYLSARAEAQPQLEEVAAAAGLSPHHFQRVFSRWVGVSPKRFLQILTVDRAKALLRERNPQLLVADEVGLSSGSRLHDHFVSLEAATPGEYGSAGEGIDISYGVTPSPFGKLFVAQTTRGICRLEFLAAPDADSAALRECVSGTERSWPCARLQRNDRNAAVTASRVFNAPPPITGPLSLHVRGTNFQVAVWRALLKLAPGQLMSYAELAAGVGKPRAARAVGAAVGANPVAYLIPCHRVIRQTGELGGYRWGLTRKRAMLSWEAARLA